MHHTSKFCSPPESPATALSMPVPASTGPGVNSLLDFVGPQPRHYGGCSGVMAMTGAMSAYDLNDHVLRDRSFDSGALDAPEFISQGSVELHRFSSFTMAFHTVRRPS